MHIVFITSEYPKKGLAQGGVGSFVCFLGKKLIKKGFNVSVIGVNNEFKYEESSDFGVAVYRVKMSKWKIGKFYQNTIRLKRVITAIHKKNKIDILEGSELSFAFLNKKTPFKKVIRMHGGHHFFTLELKNKLSKWKSYQEKISFSKADSFVSVSNYVGKKTKLYLNFDFNFTTIYNSIDIHKFKKSNNKLVEENTLLFVGTVCEKKGIRQLVQAVPIILKKFKNVKLKIVGRDWFYPNGDSYIDYLKSFINNSISDNIEFIGAVDHSEIPSLIDKAEICIYPSHMEAMPIAWLEGLAKGKAVVASNIGPGKEAIEDTITGLLCNPFDPSDIADKINLLLSNKLKANLLGDNARNDILKRFNPDDIVKMNIEFYKSIIN